MEVKKLTDKIQILIYKKGERVKEDYDILEAIIINNHYEIVLASRLFNGEEQFVSWEHNLHNNYEGHECYYDGHYFSTFTQAYRDFYLRTKDREIMKLGTMIISDSYFR